MKNAAITVIAGFIAGLVISGVLVDIIKFVGKSFSGVKTAWTIVKSNHYNEVYYRENFPQGAVQNITMQTAESTE